MKKEIKKKSLIEKFKEQPFPVKVLAIIGMLWAFPFFESIFLGGLSGFSMVLSIIGTVGLLYLGAITMFIPLFKQLFKKK